MKSISFLSIVTLGILAGALPQTQSATVEWRQLPPVVQRTINDERGPAGIVSIERLDRSGAPMYEVRLNGPGQGRHFAVTEAGTLVNLNETVSFPAPGDSRLVSFSSLPVAVQNTIRGRVGSAPIQKIELVAGPGQSSYVVPYRVGDEVLDLWIDPNGSVLASSPPRVLLSSPKRINLGDLPRTVQDAMRSFTQGTALDGVRQGKVQGRTVYEVTLDRQGRPMDLRFFENGSLVRDAVNDRFLAETGRLPVSNIATAPNAPVRIPLTDRTAVSFNQLPQAVMSAIQKYAGSDLVEKIEKGVAAGQTMYQAVLRHAGEAIPLRIAENGSMVNDDVNSWCLARLGQVPDPSGRDDWRSAPVRAALTDVGRLTFEQLPLAVQNTLRYYAGGALLHNLVRGMVNGDPVYQADTTWRGEDVQLRIAEDGTLVTDLPNARFLSRFEVSPGRNPATGQGPVFQQNRATGTWP
jgi:hypothetical protein